VKRTATFIMLIVFSVAMLLPLSLNTPTVIAQDNYTVQRVDHEVEVMYSGQAVIRDTIQVSGQLTGDFLIGFPSKYGGAYVYKGIAYDEDNNFFPVSLGVQLAEPGFYGAKVSFPEGAPQVFTVAFILSNSLLSQESAGNVFTLDFPAYPSLTKEVAYCNVELVFPATPPIITVTKDDGEVSTNNFFKSNLPAFTYSPASVTFSMPTGSLEIIDIKELTRQITISPAGDTAASDMYRITNNSPNTLGSLKIGVPRVASDVVARDEFGRILTTSTLSSSSNTRFLNVTLASFMYPDTSTTLTAEYTLPSVSSTDPFTVNFALFPDFDYYVDTAKVTFIPPEGARFLSPTLSAIDSSSSLSRETFQETLSISKEGVNKIESEVLSEEVQIAYNYSPLWLSFRPALWTWILAVVGCVVVTVWKRPKTSTPLRIATTEASISLSPENVRAFTEAYDEKSRLTSEIDALDARAQKGKMPRRRYKVQRRTLEVRLENISKNITGLKKLLRSVGGNYANLVRQLDVAEAELAEVETNNRRIGARHRKGALPLGAYKKSQLDNQRRKEKAEATINGILLRLREETR
jgi:DNA-binding XRE family transcriptional regulator